MKTFIYLLIVMVVFLPLTSVQSRGQEAIEGTYAIFSGDQKIETDEFIVVPGEKYSDDIRSVGAKQEHRVAQIIYNQGSLESYEQTIDGLPAARATNDLKNFKLYEKEAIVGLFPVEENILLLDPNLYSQFGFILRVFEQQKKEKARWNVCVPQMQDFVYVDVERHGADEITVGNKVINAVHYRVVIGKRDIVNCWVDGERVIGLHLVTKNLIVADESYDRLYESLKKIVNRAL